MLAQPTFCLKFTETCWPPDRRSGNQVHVNHVGTANFLFGEEAEVGSDIFIFTPHHPNMLLKWKLTTAHRPLRCWVVSDFVPSLLKEAPCEKCFGRKMFWKTVTLPPLPQHPHPIFGQRPKHIFLLGASLTVEFCIRSQGSLDICSSLAWENLKCLRKVQPGNAASSYICQIMHYSAVSVISKGIP